jgi:predicted PurR-regulated permease PerM
VERDPLVRGLLLLLAAICLIWLGGWAWQVASRFSDVILLFFLAWLLAFILNPVARRLRALGLPQPVAVGAVYAGLLVLMAAIGVLIIPTAVAQLIQLASSLPALASDLQARADELHLSLVERGLPEAQLADIYRNAISRAETAGTILLTNTLSVASAVLNSLLRGLLVLIISFYLMLEGDRMALLFLGALPERYREDAAAAMEQVDRTFGGFVRGQLLQGAVYGLGTAVVMEIANLPYALVISIFAGVVMLIPIIGPFLAMAPPIVLVLILAPGRVWWVFLLLYVLQFVVLNVLAPRIMSRSVGIHPLLVFASVLIGTQVASAWGAIFGVPVAAMLSLLARVFYQRVVLHMPLYRKGARLSPEALVPSTPLRQGDVHPRGGRVDDPEPHERSDRPDRSAPPERTPVTSAPSNAPR